MRARIVVAVVFFLVALAGVARASGGAGPVPATLCPDPQPPLMFDDFNVYQPPSLPETAPRVPFRDPVFGTCVVRVTDRQHDIQAPDTSGGLKNEYSRVQSFNSDESRLIVRSTGAYWYLYDAATLLPIRQLPFQGPNDPRWSATDPRVVYYSDGTRLMMCDVEAATTSTVHDFAADFPGQNLIWVSTRYEGSPSRDGRYWGLMAQANDANWTPVAFIFYDAQTDHVITRDMRPYPSVKGVDSVTISPLGDYFVAQFDYCARGTMGTDASPCGLMVYDANLQNGRGLVRIIGHSDLALDADGREVMIYQENDTDHITVVDLATGATRDLFPIDFSHVPIGLHFSGRSLGLPGWAVVSTHDATLTSDTWMDDEVFAVELKAGGHQVRLAHTHSLVDPNQDHDYWAEPQASVNRNLTKVLFTSNWGRSGTDQVEMYMIDLPAGWAGCSVTCSASAPSAAQVNTSVGFQASASSAGCTGALVYDWDFGDGSAHAATQSPTHTFAATGTFTWTFKASSGSTYCAKTGSIIVTTEPPCILSCTATVPASAVAGTPVAFQASATPTSCGGDLTYGWSFGDGSSPSADQNPSHTYAAAGTFGWTMAASIGGTTCTKSGSIAVSAAIVPPAISGVTPAGSPWKLKVAGSGFQDGVAAFIGGDATAWGGTVRRSDSLVVLKGGASLKALFPRGQSVAIRVVNPDGGEATASYTRP